MVLLIKLLTQVTLLLMADDKHPDKLGVSLENKKTVFLINCLAASRPTLTLNDMLNKKTTVKSC